MIDLAKGAWPPAPIETVRLVLRAPEARDRSALVELFASPEVGAHLGGPRPRAEIERSMPGAPERRPGRFVVALGSATIGQVTLTRAVEHPSPAAVGKLDLGYLFLPHAWGHGYAAEACAAALAWRAAVLPGEPVVLTTRTANVRSMRLAARLGFTEVERFEAYGAEQWLGVLLE
ncbi:GNAT family N-acetyltransferase [Streptomyces sp. RM99]|uniref:GNAT family N-acetyltransferase n=1 Tax=Streptomyces sp. RM99 TaxID=2824897 RepID=UPI001B35A8E5|nr:GNAT family N-acetyltransferase [Streptomyces sp. RM99]MBQ0910709.1 GNAT family N-acetyltransferase [Streptomyces sp. RM99]